MMVTTNLNLISPQFVHAQVSKPIVIQKTQIGLVGGCMAINIMLLFFR